MASSESSDGRIRDSDVEREVRGVFVEGAVEGDVEFVHHRWVSPSGKGLFDMSKTSEYGDMHVPLACSHTPSGKTSANGEQNEDEIESAFFEWWRARNTAAKTRFTVQSERTHPFEAGMVGKDWPGGKASHLPVNTSYVFSCYVLITHHHVSYVVNCHQHVLGSMISEDILPPCARRTSRLETSASRMWQDYVASGEVQQI